MMKINYKELMEEISSEVAEGILTQKDQIQVLRAEQPVFQDYRPIIEWYYDAFAMEEELGTPLEEMYMKEEFSSDEWKEMIKEQEEYKKQYQADQPKLQQMTVKDVLTEMKQIQKLF